MRAELRGDFQDVIAPRAELRLKRNESNMSLWRKLRRQAMVAFTLLGMGLGFSVNSPLPTWGQVQEIPQTTSTSEEQDTSKEPITELLGKLKDTDTRVRKSAARALGLIKDKSAVPALIEILKGDDWRVRQAAVQALGQIKDKSAVPALMEALKDDDWRVRFFAARALTSVKTTTQPATQPTTQPSD